MGNSKVRYPMVELDLKKFRHNIDQVIEKCGKQGIGIAGVIKGFTGIPEGSKEFADAGCDYIASSRLEQIEVAKNFGIKTPMMLIRVPMLSEIEDVVRLTEISLNSEVSVLKALNEECGVQGKKHKVILMDDLGDLREGFWYKKDLLAAAILVEKELTNLELAGIGTNLGCYGSIEATPLKMEELIKDAETIEEAIGRKLEIISGGATTSFPLVLKGTMPERINNLRMGEGVILAKDLRDLWGLDMSFMNQDAFTLKAEIIELKDKPSYPVGQITFDAFGNVETYVDRGIRKRALLGLGKVDVAFPDKIFPREKGIEVIGASSDHLILDIQDCEKELKVGDIIEFDLCYASICFVTNSPNLRIVCK